MHAAELKLLVTFVCHISNLEVLRLNLHEITANCLRTKETKENNENLANLIENDYFIFEMDR